MSGYRTHTLDSAPEASRNALQTLQKNFGLIPNLAATMAASPTLVNGFVGALVNFAGGTFNGAERQVLLLTNAVTNECAWAVAFHSTAALREGVHSAIVQSIRDGHVIADERFNALSALTRKAIENRGHLRETELADFINAGFSRDQVLEVFAGIAVSTMANYAGNVTHPILEAPFKAQEWRAH